MIHDDSASISHNISGWIDTTDSLSRDPRDLLLNHPGDGHTLGLEILGVVAWRNSEGQPSTAPITGFKM